MAPIALLEANPDDNNEHTGQAYFVSLLLLIFMKKGITPINEEKVFLHFETLQKF